RPRLDLDEVAVGGRRDQAVEVQVELDAAIDEQRAAPIFFDDMLGCRTEVLAIEARGMRGGREITRSEEQHRAECLLTRPAGERQPRSRAADLAILVEELVLAIAQPALIRILERPVRVALVIVARSHDRDLFAREN